MKTNNITRSILRGILSVIIVIGILLALFIRIPYYVMQPGSAEDVSQFVKINGKPAVKQSGDFYLTTVSLGKGIVYDYLFSWFSNDIKLIPEEQILSNLKNDEEYNRQQKENMIQSQNAALISAFHAAKKPVTINYQGVEVFSLKNKNGLEVGDLIQQVDQSPIRKSEDLISYLNTKQIGEEVQVSLIRVQKVAGKEKWEHLKRSITLVDVSDPREGKKRPGLGIYPITREKINTNPPVTIQAGEIGGPSAGLMFTLEVLDQITVGDMTHGKKIAGTGTMNDVGEVGQIGGIEFKVRAANERGVEIFFCPKDIQPQDNNEKTAKLAAKQIQTKMKIVPVATLKDALRYLEQLKPVTAMAS